MSDSTAVAAGAAARRSALLRVGLPALIGLGGLTIGCTTVAYYAS